MLNILAYPGYALFTTQTAAKAEYAKEMEKYEASL